MNRYERELKFIEEQKMELRNFKEVAERILLGKIKPSADKIKELDDFRLRFE